MIAFDVAAAGNNATGPTTNTLTTPWSHNSGVESGILLAGFSYDTTAPNSRSVGRNVTFGGEPMEMIQQVPKGYWPYIEGAPGYVELWGAVIEDTGAATVSVGLSYDQDTGDPWSEDGATFSNFRGSSVSFGGLTSWGPSSSHSSSNEWISAPISGFQNTFTVGVIGCDSGIEDDFNQTTLFQDPTNTLLIGQAQGSGAFKLQGNGGPWGICMVQLRPVVYLADNQGNGIIW